MGKLFHDDGPLKGKLKSRADLKSVQLAPVIHGGYDHATGGYVEGVKDQRDKLNRKSDEMSERMGFEVNYQQIGAADTRTLGVGEHGLPSPAPAAE